MDKFLEKYKLFMESIEDGRFKYVGQKIAIVPGSFKPPHKGHWEMVMHYVEEGMDKVLVLISNISERAISSRPLSKGNIVGFAKLKQYIEKNNVDLSATEMKTVYDALDMMNAKENDESKAISFDRFKEILLSIKGEDENLNRLVDDCIEKMSTNMFKTIRKTSKGTEITPEMSKEIFEIYAKAYDVQDKVSIEISESASPVGATFYTVENECKDCEVKLGVSKKGGDDARWNNLQKSENNPTNKVESDPVEVKTMLSATDLRNNIDNLKREWFPEKISNKDFEDIKCILNGEDEVVDENCFKPIKKVRILSTSTPVKPKVKKYTAPKSPNALKALKPIK